MTLRPPQIIEIRNLEMSFADPAGRPVPVLKVGAWDMADGAQVALLGLSGSGKTTLLHILSGIRTPVIGSVRVAGQDITAFSESSRDVWRSQTIGYIFQNYYLFPALTVLENIVLPLTFAGVPPGPRKERALQILEQLELDHRSSFYPHQLSTGEKQRVVIARALVNRPRVVLADEPSANLDSRRRRILIEMLRNLAGQHHSSLLVATHDQELAALFPERVNIEDLK